MIDIQDLRAQMNRGDRIASFIHDEDVQAVVHGLLQQYTADVMEDRESPSWERAKALGDVMMALESHVTSGKMAAEQLAGMKR